MWIRRVALGMLGLLLVLAAVLTWLVMGFDANRYKGIAIEWMQTHHNRTLTINGPIGLSLFPRLQLTLADVSLSEAGRPDEFAGLERAELAVDVLPLLDRELVIGRISARGVRARRTLRTPGASAARSRPGSTSAASNWKTCACTSRTKWPASRAI